MRKRINYRIYPSTTAILSDLILAGMHLRNAYYEARVQQELAAGRKPELAFFVEMIGDSLLLYPEFSKVYVEFLWEKQRNPQLSQLYQQICQVTVQETEALIRRYDAQLILPPQTLLRLTELMNSAILSLHVLGLQELFSAEKDRICQAITQLLTPENEIEKENYHA